MKVNAKAHTSTSWCESSSRAPSSGRLNALRCRLSPFDLVAYCDFCRLRHCVTILVAGVVAHNRRGARKGAEGHIKAASDVRDIFCIAATGTLLLDACSGLYFLARDAKRLANDLRDWPQLRVDGTPIKTPLKLYTTSQPTTLRSRSTRHSNMSRPLSLFSVQAILVLAIDDGSRILTKYYSNPHPPPGPQTEFPGQQAYKSVKDQKAFEKGLLGVCYGIIWLGGCRSDSIYREDSQADNRHHII